MIRPPPAPPLARMPMWRRALRRVLRPAGTATGGTAGGAENAPSGSRAGGWAIGDLRQNLWESTVPIPERHVPIIHANEVGRDSLGRWRKGVAETDHTIA